MEKEGAEGPRTGGGRASRAKGRGPPGRGMVRGGGKGPRSAEKGKEKGRKKKGEPAQSKCCLPDRSLIFLECAGELRLSPVRGSA